MGNRNTKGNINKKSSDKDKNKKKSSINIEDLKKLDPNMANIICDIENINNRPFNNDEEINELTMNNFLGGNNSLLNKINFNFNDDNAELLKSLVIVNKTQKNINNNVNNEIGNIDNNQINNIVSNQIINNQIPKKVFLFNNINIFNSFLIMFNHIIYVNNYLNYCEDKIKNFICENGEYCLTGILYYINKYLWAENPEEIKSKNDFSFIYESFLNFFIHNKFQISNYESYLYDVNNTIDIICFIFNKLNEELTFLNKKYNPIIQFFNSNDMQLNTFMNNLRTNNISIISDYFTGIYTTNYFCNNCMMKYNEYNPIHYLMFDLSKIFMNNQFNNSNLNIYICINQEFNQTYFFSCACGGNAGKNMQFYLFPNILTIILKNNFGNFFINDNIDLTNYTYIKEFNNYYLIAILCKYTFNNTYITYCFNYKDNNWYCFENNQINDYKVTYLDANAIPYALVYQKFDGNINFNYNPINLNMANNKIEYIFKFRNVSQEKLFFEVNETVEGAKKKIEKYKNMKNVNFLVNALVRQNNEKLSEITFSTNDRIILVV